MADLIDITERRAKAPTPDKNLATALEESAQMTSALTAQVMRAQLAALMGIDGLDAIRAARLQAAHLIQQLDFAERLAERRRGRA